MLALEKFRQTFVKLMLTHRKKKKEEEEVEEKEKF